MSKDQARVAAGIAAGVSAEQLAAASAAVAAVAGTRVAGGAPVVAGGAPVVESPKTPVETTLALDPKAPVRGTGRRFTKFWWQAEAEDLAMVTDEDNNPALGIIKLEVQAPTANQKAVGILCKVAMETLTGMDFGITIRESKEPGDIMLMVGGARKIEATPEQKAQGKKDDYIRDRRLNDATTAQILRFVWKHLRPKAQPVQK